MIFENLVHKQVKNDFILQFSFFFIRTKIEIIFELEII